MSTPRRRTRRARSGGAETPAQPLPASVGRALAPVTPWRWRTFPVYFAFSLGGFIGLYLGMIAQAVNNGPFTIVVFVLFASLLGFGFSRITTRFMLARNWVKPRAAKKK